MEMKVLIAVLALACAAMANAGTTTIDLVLTNWEHFNGLGLTTQPTPYSSGSAHIVYQDDGTPNRTIVSLLDATVTIDSTVYNSGYFEGFTFPGSSGFGFKTSIEPLGPNATSPFTLDMSASWSFNNGQFYFNRFLVSGTPFALNSLFRPATVTATVSQVPTSGSAALLGIGLGVMGLQFKRRKV
jgi:hypothetical protein